MIKYKMIICHDTTRTTNSGDFPQAHAPHTQYRYVLEKYCSENGCPNNVRAQSLKTYGRAR